MVIDGLYELYSDETQVYAPVYLYSTFHMFEDVMNSTFIS